MAEDKVLKFRRVAEELYLKESILNKLTLLLESPVIIVTKGDPTMGRKLASFYVASILRCPLIKEHDFDNHQEKSEENKAKVWRKICSLAGCQLSLGSSVIIDTDSLNKHEFDQLKELSEITKIPLAVFEYRVNDAEELLKSLDGDVDDMDNSVFIFNEFMEKPRSQYINSTNFDMGEVPKILVEMEDFWYFNTSVYNAMQELQAHIFPDFESQKANACDHLFEFTDIEEYKRPCSQCRQLVSGSVYRCLYCRFVVHRNCSYFPESLKMGKIRFRKIFPSEMVTLNLRYIVTLLNVDSRCICCKQLLRGRTSSRYYSSEDGLVLFDLDCLFLLPAKLKTEFHKHELLRIFRSTEYEYDSRSNTLFSVKECKECDASIDEGTILYYCPQCHIPFDMYCLWLHETVEFNHHRHPFKLSIVPRLDPYPYYCEVCQNKRDTERWIYYCAECDYPIHPRCIIKVPCLPRYLSTEISTANQNSKEKLSEMKSHSYSSYLTIETLMAKEVFSQHRHELTKLRLLFKELTKEIEVPVIIATRGHSYTGRKLAAFTLAIALDCLLLDKDHVCEVTNTANEPFQVFYQDLSRIALSQLQIGLSVVIDCDLSHESEFLILRDFALATETPLFIVECKPCNEDKLEDSEYDVGDTPKLFLNVITPTFDDIKKFIPPILHSISSYCKEWTERDAKEPDTPSCYIHKVILGTSYNVLDADICNRCGKKLSAPILECFACGLILHKGCTELPLRIEVSRTRFLLKRYGDNNDKVRCVCCNELIQDYAYSFSDNDSFICLDLDCLFQPPKPGVDLHDHPIQLEFSTDHFECQACGSICRQKLRYSCIYKYDSWCSFEIGVKCGWLEETVMFDRHCHPFHLSVSPEHYSNQYYCDVCQEERDKKHLVYCCIGCEFFIHIRCLVPTGCCPP